jgi:hypothetical protein
MKTLKTSLIAVALFTVATPSMAAEPLTELTNALASSVSTQVIEMSTNLKAELGASLNAAAAEFVSSASEVAEAAVSESAETELEQTENTVE